MTKFRLAFDARYCRAMYTGIGRYTFSTLYWMLKAPHPGMQTSVVVADDMPENSPLHSLLRKHPPDRIIETRHKLFSATHHLLDIDECDGYFYPHFDVPLAMRAPAICVIHDLFPIMVPGYLRQMACVKALYFRVMTGLSLRKCRATIAVSNSTKNDILTSFPRVKEDSVHVISEDGSSLDMFGATDEAHKSSCEIPKDHFLLYVGDRRPHKNIKLMLDVFESMVAERGYDGNLLLVGAPEPYGFDYISYISSLSSRDHIRVLNRQSEENLQRLYRRADTLLLLSKYEGFGLPILEAARVNTPVVATNISSMPEVAPPGSSLLLDPELTSRAAAEQISAWLRTIDRENIDNTDHVMRFSWQKTAHQITDLFLAVC